MTLISSSFPNLNGGVSQQPPSQRLENQCEAQENSIPLVIGGLTKRPPTEFVAQLKQSGGAPAKLNGDYIHFIQRDENEKYILGIETNGSIYVWDLDGNHQLLYTPTGTNVINYFSDAGLQTPDETIRAVTIGDLTWIVNTIKTVRMTAARSPYSRGVNAREALIWIKTSGQGARFKVKVKVGTAAEQTVEVDHAPGELHLGQGTGQHAIDPSIPSTADFAELATFGPTGTTGEFTVTGTPLNSMTNVTAQRVGSVIWMTATEDFQVTVEDSYGQQGHVVIKEKAVSFEDLPAIAKNGQIILVEGNPETDVDDYYVKFETNGGIDFGNGLWIETIGPNLRYEFDPDTMPHILVRQPNGSWVIKPADGQPPVTGGDPNMGTRWLDYKFADRAAGSDLTNPVPSFVDASVSDITYFKGRLAITSGENVSLSEAGEFFNFFRTTVTQLLDSAPIDIGVGGTAVNNLKRAVDFSDRLLLFSERAQFVLQGDPILTPATAAVTRATSFNAATSAAPVPAGSTLFFPFSRGTFSGVREFYKINENDLNFDAVESSLQIPRYIRGAIRKMSASNHEDMLIVLAQPLDTIYCYKFFGGQQNRLQSAWFTMKLENAEIVSAEFLQDSLFLVTYRDGLSYLERMDVQTGRVDEDSDYLTYLDYRTKIEVEAPDPQIVLGGELVSNGTFDSGTTGWTPSPEAVQSLNLGAMRLTYPWNPTALFRNGEQGAWYDPSDLSTLFQDTAGTTPAGVGDPVGLILDKSKGRDYPAQFFPDIPVPLFSTTNAIQAALIENASIANSGVYYVSPSTGSDSNPGTEVAPFQTVSRAIRTATGAASRVVMLEDAVIEPFDLRSSDASQTTQQFKWLDANGFNVTIRVAGPNLSSQTWVRNATYGNCYTTVLPLGASEQVTRVLNQSLADDYGYDTPLREYPSAASLNTAADAGYYWDNSTKTLWMNIDGNVEAQKANYRALYLNSAGTSRIFVYGASLGLSGVMLEGVQIVSLDAAGRRPEVWMHDVEQVYAYGKGGDVRGWYVATDCTVYGSGADGCNAFTAWAGGKSLIQDVRCRFIRSGDRRTFAVNGSNQGVSAHGGSYHIAYDCEYIENNGQGVADTCVNSSTDYSWLIDCRAVGGAQGVTADNFLFGSGATSAQRFAFLENCVSESPSANDLRVDLNSTVQRLNSNFASVSGVSLPYGSHATQSTPAFRPTLQATSTPATLGSEEITNGTFGAGLTGWTSGAFDPATLDAGGAKIERNASTNSALIQTGVFVLGTTYQISYDILSGSGSTGASLLIAGQTVNSVVGSHSFVYTATTTTFEARCYLNNFATLDNISVKEVLTFADPEYYLDFDGTDDLMSATFVTVQAQPNTIAVALKFDQGSRNEYVVDGIGSDRNGLYKPVDKLFLYAGSNVPDPSAAGTSEIIAFGHFNTTSSALRVNGVQVATGDAGALDWGGITLASNRIPSNWMDGRIYGFIGVSRTLTANEIDFVESYLADKAAVTLP